MGGGGKGICKKIRKINKGKKPHEPVYDPAELPAESIVAVDVSTVLVPFVKSDEGAAQQNAIPKQSATSVMDRMEGLYVKKLEPFSHKMLCCVDAALLFKDQVVRHKRNKIALESARRLQAARSATVFTKKLITQVRKAEKGTAKVTCDVIANVVRWAQRRPGITAVSHQV